MYFLVLAPKTNIPLAAQRSPAELLAFNNHFLCLCSSMLCCRNTRTFNNILVVLVGTKPPKKSIYRYINFFTPLAVQYVIDRIYG